MRKILIHLIILGCLISIPFAFSSCNKLKALINPFDIFLNSKDIPITIQPSAAGQQFATTTTQFNLADEINKQNTSGISVSLKNIKSATVDAVSMDITNPSIKNNFANVIDGGVLLSTDANANTQQKATLGQVLGNSDVYSTHFEIPIVGTKDLTEYLKGTNFFYTYAYDLRREIKTPLQCVIHVKYKVTMQP